MNLPAPKVACDTFPLTVFKISFLDSNIRFSEVVSIVSIGLLTTSVGSQVKVQSE